MSEVLQLTDVACVVVEITETLTEYRVKFERTEWTLVHGEGDDATYETVDATMPGAKFTFTGEVFELRLNDADGLDVGSHYQMRVHKLDRDQDDEL